MRKREPKHVHTYGPWQFPAIALDWPPGTVGPSIMRGRCVCGDEQIKSVLVANG